MNSGPPVHRHPDFDALSRELAAQIAANLNAGIAARGRASLVVSGGQSPIKFFEYLRAQAVEWTRVCVALADERWVEPSDSNSNERLVRDVLLGDRGAAAECRRPRPRNPV